MGTGVEAGGCGMSGALGKGFELIREKIIHPKKNDPRLNPDTKSFEEVKKEIIDESTSNRIKDEISTPLLELLLLKKKDGTLDYQAMQKLGSSLTKVGAEIAGIYAQKTLSDVKRDELLADVTEILEEILLRC